MSWLDDDEFDGIWIALPPMVLSTLRHLYQQLLYKGEKQMAEGLLSPVIAALETGEAGRAARHHSASNLDALRWGANVAETLLSIGRSIGFGRAQQILGEQWDAEYGCAPRGRMGVTVKDAEAVYARHFFDAGWKAAASFCDREDVRADGIVGDRGCPQFEAAFKAAQKGKGAAP